MTEFAAGQRLQVRRGQMSVIVDVQMAQPDGQGGWSLFVRTPEGNYEPLLIPAGGSETVRLLESDGAADSARVIAGMWTQWMAAANHNARTTILAATTLQPYIHQANAVYGAMMPQPMLRFLLADEPGTGKTIMAGMYLREMQRLGLIRKALIVAPAGLVSKWQADFDRFFGGGLRRITAETVYQHALDVDHDMWIVSLELASMNGNVQDALRPDRAGWDVVVFDEAHRMTPTAPTLMRVGRLLALGTPRALLMTATPHRGKEWYFRHLLHLVDPSVYPDPGMAEPRDDEELPQLRPGEVHYLRRMKESLVHNDGETPLFKGRTAANLAVPLSAVEAEVYERALAMVDRFFPVQAQALARMVYGKRAASTLWAIRETLNRRITNMGDTVSVTVNPGVDPYDDDVRTEEDEHKVTHADSVSVRAEKKAIGELVDDIDRILESGYTPSKWHGLITDILTARGIEPGNGEQAVVFTEYADSADWIEQRLTEEGYTARVYSGRLNTPERDAVREAFMRREYQIIVSTDAGNEGIDLQSAHVLVNYDIPWSLVRLEQRMGRIHRVGQDRDVYLYNLVASDTREGETLLRLLNNFVTAANEMNGQLFDSLSLVAELGGVEMERWLTALYGNDPAARQEAIAAADAVRAADLKARAEVIRHLDDETARSVDAHAALTLMQDDLLERINPAIVAEYLNRLAKANYLTVQPTAHGVDGILALHRAAGLPTSLRETPGSGPVRAATIATSGDVLDEARRAVPVGGITILGPGEPAFTDLIEATTTEFDPDLYQGGSANDITSITGYDLYAYTATFTESGGKKTTRWASLIRVDPDGSVRRVRWETLANLTPTDGTPGDPDELASQIAWQYAHDAAQADETRQRETRRAWYDRAKRQLRTLPVRLTEHLPQDQRAEERARIREGINARLAKLEELIDVSVSEPRLVGHLRINGAAQPPTPEETNSEQIAVHLIKQRLHALGYTVEDVQTEGIGYDLRARKGPEQRLVEVKGVWGSAASEGVRMTGNEVLMATQHRQDYWLYIVDDCAKGGTIIGTYRDPIATLGEHMVGEAIIKVPGRALKTTDGQDDT